MSWLFPLPLRQRLARWLLRQSLRFSLTPNDYACFKEAEKCAQDSYRDWETDRKSTRLNSSH